MKRHGWALTAIVAAGFAVRAGTIWIGRPEFVGWFNHCYYYWVQVRGLVENGRLPYTDLPFVFALYGGLARLFQLFGWPLETAIVNVTRGLMSLVPALVAVPVYGLIKGIRRERSLGLPEWTLVALSAFLPLTLVHMPELLQKNCFGLLFLSATMLAAHRYLLSRRTGALVSGLALFGLIAVTHLGTLAVTLLFGFAVLLAVCLERGSWRAIGIGLVSFSACAGVGLAILYRLDPEAFLRVELYLHSSLPSSLLGNLVSPRSDIGRPMAAIGIVVPLLLSVWLVWAYRGGRSSLTAPDRIFWLACTLFGYFLVLPVIDLDLVPRFVLFLPLPTLILLAYLLGVPAKRRLAKALVGLATVGVLAITLGEVMSLIFHDPDKKEIRRELMELKTGQRLTERDFVITRYGVNPICNWFLGTRSGLITSFSKADWRRYDRIFVLNPAEGNMAVTAGPTNRYREKEAYWITRGNVPLPTGLVPVVQTGHLTFHELRRLPEEWVFDSEGNWSAFAPESGAPPGPDSADGPPTKQR